jgi:hypothetical protein
VAYFVLFAQYSRPSPFKGREEKHKNAALKAWDVKSPIKDFKK